VSKPITGDKGVYVVKLISVNKAPEMPSYRGFANQKTAQSRQAVVSRVFEALKGNAEIEDNRAKFY
jgi:peptidylprolyl isomerase/peptidyl-prolyl cis-trans isomerase D